MSTTGVQSSGSSYMMDYAVNVAKQAKSAVTQSGDIALELIDSVATTSNVAGTNGTTVANSNSSTGSIVDFLA